MSVEYFERVEELIGKLKCKLVQCHSYIGTIEMYLEKLEHIDSLAEADRTNENMDFLYGNKHITREIDEFLFDSFGVYYER